MKDKFNFSKAKRGQVVEVPEGKTRITIRIDSNTLNWGFASEFTIVAGATTKRF